MPDTQTRDAARETAEIKNRKADKQARKTAKKEARKQRRNERRAAYLALSGGRKFLRWLIGGVAAAAVLAFLWFVGGQLFDVCVTRYVEKRYQESLSATASREEILLAAPEDTAGAARVAATAAYEPDDTWAIYLYICGSNLESQGRNRLSDVTSFYVRQESQAYSAQQSDTMQRRFHTFVEEMQQQGMRLPDYLFLPTGGASVSGAESESGGSESADESTPSGYATKNIADILSVSLPENVSLVIQTGGAYSWDLSWINPNASQRFLYNSEGLAELTAAYPKNMGSGQTFADFLQFCRTEYPADHQMLLIWNHGSGPFGFCNDEIYGGDGITLPEMSDAFSTVYGDSPAAPPFELVGFDACLMASTEVAEALNGYTRYLVASEETEAGDGWSYGKWLGELAAHPEMNGAQLGKVITDSFVEYCANFSINMKWLQFESVATMSVVDVAKAHTVYEAYTRLCAAALEDAAASPWPLAALGRAAAKSVRYAGSAYKYFNTIDLGAFMRKLAPDYPQQCAAVLDALDDAVLYHRETSYTQGSEGLSIYFPTNVDSLEGLIYYLEYMDTVCVDPDMKTLYYYKIAGCLNEELQAYANTAGYGAFGTLDTAPLEQLAALTPTVCADNSVELPIDNEAAWLIQDMSVSIARYDPDAEEICFYGEDSCLYLDEYRNLRTTFDGRWVMLDGHILSLEVIDQTDAFIRYRSPVRYNDSENAYLVLACNLADGAFSILGVQTIDEAADTFGRNLAPIEIGSKITPCYRVENLADEAIREDYGDEFTFRANSRVESAKLQDGAYYLVISITDTRGDAFYPPLVSFCMEGGAMTDMAVADDLAAYPSAE